MIEVIDAVVRHDRLDAGDCPGSRADRTPRMRNAGALGDGPIRLHVDRGEGVAVFGLNGSGKSTLLKSICGLESLECGRVVVDGRIMAEPGRAALNDGVGDVPLIGYVGQDPDRQSVAPVVFDEVAFGPSNLGLPRDEVVRRVSSALECCGLSDLATEEVASLSGGQRQRVAIAGALAMGVDYLVLDEACSMLDYPSRRALSDVVDGCRSRGIGVVHATHDPCDVEGFDRACILYEGAAVWAGPVRDVMEDTMLSELAGFQRFVASPRRAVPVASSTGTSGGALDGPRIPDCRRLTFDGAGYSYRSTSRRGGIFSLKRDGRAQDGLGARHLVESGVPYAIEPATISFDRGSVTYLAGRNGSGKTTLLRLAAGLLEPSSGSVAIDGRPVHAGDVSFAFQHAAEQLFAQTVLADVTFGPGNAGFDRATSRRIACRALQTVGMSAERFGPKNPFCLSGGQMRRVVLAGAIALERPFLLLDEPSAGLDGPARKSLSSIIAGLADAGVGVVLASHDADWALDVADRLVILEQGRVTFDGAPDRAAIDAMVRAGLYPQDGSFVHGAVVPGDGGVRATGA